MSESCSEPNYLLMRTSPRNIATEHGYPAICHLHNPNASSRRVLVAGSPCWTMAAWSMLEGATRAGSCPRNLISLSSIQNSGDLPASCNIRLPVPMSLTWVINVCWSSSTAMLDRSPPLNYGTGHRIPRRLFLPHRTSWPVILQRQDKIQLSLNGSGHRLRASNR